MQLSKADKTGYLKLRYRTPRLEYLMRRETVNK